MRTMPARLYDRPDVVAHIVEGVAAGEAPCTVGARIGLGNNTALKTARTFEDMIERRRKELIAKVVRSFGEPVAARLRDASNDASRTGASSFLALMELLGWRQDRGSKIQIGDVFNSVQVDGRSVNLGSVPTAQVMADAGELLRGLLDTSGHVSPGQVSPGAAPAPSPE